HAMALRPSSVPLRVPLPPPPESSLPAIPDPESDRAHAASPTVTRLLTTIITDPSFESTAASALVVELVDFAAACRLQYATALVAESESANPPSVGGECALGTDVLQDRQEDFECLAAPVPRFASMLLAFKGDPDAPDIPTPRSYTERLRGSLHDEIWLRRPPGFTGSSPAGTKWSLPWPVYGIRQAPWEWHNTQRTTLAALGFTPSTADPSLFLCTDTSQPPFYVLVYIDDLVFAIADTKALTLITRDRVRRTITLTQSHMVHQVLHRFGFQFSSPQPTPLSTGHSLSAPLSDESVEPSGPYPELVGCLITWGMGLVLGGRGPGVLTGHVDASWRSTCSSLVLSSSCEADIYAGAMATQELRWLTYLLIDLGDQPRFPPVLYVDNKAMIALCQEHRTKHMALQYFLAR
ncbi:unnamed protein product, partial [Closterium sp. NIES-53]